MMLDEKPWWYYLRIFGWHRERGVFWHQIGLSALALVGFAVALVRRDTFLRGMALYAVGVTLVFSLFAYKTPWHTVHFVPGYAVLAAATLGAIARLRTGRLVATLFAAVVALTLHGQAKLAAFLRPAEERNPYAWFTAFAPADAPEVAVAVFIEDANVARGEISGGGLAGPIAKAVMEAVINQ